MRDRVKYLALIIILLSSFFIILSQYHLKSPNVLKGTDRRVSSSPKGTGIESYIKTLSPNFIVSDLELTRSLNYTTLVEFSQKGDYNSAIKYCIDNVDPQRCFTEFGSVLFRNNPSDIEELDRLCLKLSSNNTLGRNRTPDKFCSSGVYYTLVNQLLNDSDVLVEGNELISYCFGKVSDSASYPCLQEAGRYVRLSNPLEKLETLVSFCSGSHLLRNDQCKSGIFRGNFNLLKNDVFNNFSSCHFLSNFSDVVKCSLVAGMSFDGKESARLKVGCKEFTGKGLLNCYRSIGSFFDGYVHGEHRSAIELCYRDNDPLFYNNCILGIFDGFLYNLNMYRYEEGVVEVLELCTLDFNTFKDIRFQNYCFLGSIDLLTPKDITVSNLDKFLFFCEKDALDKSFCESVLGYKIREFGLSERSETLKCREREFCRNGVIKENLLYREKLNY